MLVSNNIQLSLTLFVAVRSLDNTEAPGNIMSLSFMAYSFFLALNDPSRKTLISLLEANKNIKSGSLIVSRFNPFSTIYSTLETLRSKLRKASKRIVKNIRFTSIFRPKHETLQLDRHPEINVPPR
jgi:hypothetical protein